MAKSKFSVITLVVASAVVIFAVSGWAWFHYNRSKPTTVFDRMLSTMLTTSSVTKQISQEEGGQKLDQTIQLTTSPSAQVHSKNVLDQGQAVITTESIGGLNNDYIRYGSIKTDQKNSAGSSFDFSSVLGTWGKSGANDPAGGEQAQLFNQTVLGVVPIANLPYGSRNTLLEQIKKDTVYTVNYGTVKRAIISGRPVYTYEVSVKPVAYINMLKTFASSLGLKQLEAVDPSQYEGTPDLKFSFQVDVWSAQLTNVTYLDSNRSENYTAYGAKVLVSAPKNPVTLEELQSRLQKIQ